MFATQETKYCHKDKICTRFGKQILLWDIIRQTCNYLAFQGGNHTDNVLLNKCLTYYFLVGKNAIFTLRVAVKSSNTDSKAGN